jgi:hypothetical protein
MKIVIRRPDAANYVCHATVTHGKIHYHTDCTHDYAGKIVKLELLECPLPTKPSSIKS